MNRTHTPTGRPATHHFTAHNAARLNAFIATLPPALKAGREVDGFGCLMQYLKARLNITPNGEIQARVGQQARALNDLLRAIERGEVPLIDPTPLEGDTRPICVHLMSDQDPDFAILGDGNIYHVLMRLKELSQRFKCVGAVVGSFDVRGTLEGVARRYPGRPIALLNLCGHGCGGEMCERVYNIEGVELIAPGGSVVFDSCSISSTPHNVAQRMSALNPHISVFAARELMIFSDILFDAEGDAQGEAPRIQSVIYGLMDYKDLYNPLVAASLITHFGGHIDIQSIFKGEIPNLSKLREPLEELFAAPPETLDSIGWGALVMGAEMTRYVGGVAR